MAMLYKTYPCLLVGNCALDPTHEPCTTEIALIVIYCTQLTILINCLIYESMVPFLHLKIIFNTWTLAKLCLTTMSEFTNMKRLVKLRREQYRDMQQSTVVNCWHMMNETTKHGNVISPDVVVLQSPSDFSLTVTANCQPGSVPLICCNHQWFTIWKSYSWIKLGGNKNINTIATRVISTINN